MIVGNEGEINCQNLNKKWKAGEIEEWKSITKKSLTFEVFLQSRLHS